MRIQEVQNQINKLPEKGVLSDGYHTFNELYEFRNVLFIKLVKANKDVAFKTIKNKEGEEWDGWFILGLNTEKGQITFHLPIEYWDECDVKEIERNSEYDGHTSNDVLSRIKSL